MIHEDLAEASRDRARALSREGQLELLCRDRSVANEECAQSRPRSPGSFHLSVIGNRVLRMSDNRRVRAVVQRVSGAAVHVEGEQRAAVGRGLLVLLGVAAGDTEADADRLARRTARLRVFENEDGRFDRSLVDIGGEALVVSQFTLVADTSKGNRPSFTGAASPDEAEPLYERFCAALRGEGVTVAQGVFGARMEVELINDGPVTITLDA